MNFTRRERKKMHSRKSIVDAAVQLFERKGYQETTVADIMQEADLGIGTFYNYFESKEDILKFLLTEIVVDANHVYRCLAQEKKSAAKLLEEMFLFSAQMIDTKRFVLPLFLTAAQKGSLPRDMMQPQERGLTFKQIFVDIVKRGQENGEFRDDIPVEVITEMFHSVFQAASFSSIPMSFMDNIRYKLCLLMDGITADRKPLA